jgi:hypothetical protein
LLHLEVQWIAYLARYLPWLGYALGNLIFDKAQSIVRRLGIEQYRIAWFCLGFRPNWKSNFDHPEWGFVDELCE